MCEIKPYTYISYYRGIPVYVGKGNGRRKNHTLNGQSNNELINEFYFRNLFFGDMLLDTYKIKEHKSDADALKHEKFLIAKYKPFCNKCDGRVHKSDYIFREKLQTICSLIGMTKPEDLESKFDFRMLFTPKGLLCTRIRLAENSPFELSDSPFHIRIKKCLHHHFPEYALQFVDVMHFLSVEYLNSFHTSQCYARYIERGENPFSSYGVGMSWVKDAYYGGSFDFVYSGSTHFSEINSEMFMYNAYRADAHVEMYLKVCSLTNVVVRNDIS